MPDIVDISVLNVEIKYLKNELERYQNQVRIQFIAAALGSTPGNFHPITAGQRAIQIADECLKQL